MRMDSQGWRRRVALPVLGAAVLLLSGCNAAIIDMAPQERIELRERAQSLLLRAAETDIDVVAANAIEALVEVGPQAGRAAFRAATRAEAAMVRFAACVAIGESRDCAASDDIARCQRDPDRSVRLAAAFAAYRCGEGGPQVLLDALANESDATVRQNAVFLIGRMGEKQALGWLKRYANDKSNIVVVLTYSAMARLGDKAALDQLILFAQGDLSSRTVALQELALLGKEEARECLYYRLSKNEQYLQARLIAARGLGKIGVNAGFNLAMQSTTYTAKDYDEQVLVRQLAAHALGSIGDARALNALQNLAESNDERVQVAACYAICQIVKPVEDAAR